MSYRSQEKKISFQSSLQTQLVGSLRKRTMHQFFAATDYRSLSLSVRVVTDNSIINSAGMPATFSSVSSSSGPHRTVCQNSRLSAPLFIPCLENRSQARQPLSLSQKPCPARGERKKEGKMERVLIITHRVEVLLPMNPTHSKEPLHLEWCCYKS